MGEFYDYVDKLPKLFEQLIESKSYPIEDLTEGKMKDLLGESNPVQGVYLMLDKETPMYVGKSKTLAQKIGTDERSLGKCKLLCLKR